MNNFLSAIFPHFGELKRGLCISVAILLTLCSSACSMTSTPEPLFTAPTESPARLALIESDSNLQAGRSSYDLLCAHCHGYGGEGQLEATIENTLSLGLLTVPAHDATGHTWQHPDQVLREAILQGIQNPLDHFPMPAFEGTLNEEEINQVLDYIRLWWTVEQREYQRNLTRHHAEIDAEFGINANE